jgi:hypothetical protein
MEKRHVRVSDHRARVDFAACIKELVDTHYPEAEQIVALSDYVATKEEMISRVAAWQSDRNTARSTVNWQFTTKDARIRLNRLYPEI